jgi:hypothetical protein
LSEQARSRHWANSNDPTGTKLPVLSIRICGE